MLTELETRLAKGSGVELEVASHESATVGQTVGKTWRLGEQEEASRFDGRAADADDFSADADLSPCGVQIDAAAGPAVTGESDLADHGVRTDFAPTCRFGAGQQRRLCAAACADCAAIAAASTTVGASRPTLIRPRVDAAGCRKRVQPSPRATLVE